MRVGFPAMSDLFMQAAIPWHAINAARGGRVNEQIAGLWTGAPPKLKTVNQWQIRCVPTSARRRLTSWRALGGLHRCCAPRSHPAARADEGPSQKDGSRE